MNTKATKWSQLLPSQHLTYFNVSNTGRGVPTSGWIFVVIRIIKRLFCSIHSHSKIKWLVKFFIKFLVIMILLVSKCKQKVDGSSPGWHYLAILIFFTWSATSQKCQSYNLYRWTHENQLSCILIDSDILQACGTNKSLFNGCHLFF